MPKSRLPVLSRTATAWLAWASGLTARRTPRTVFQGRAIDSADSVHSVHSVPHRSVHQIPAKQTGWQVCCTAPGQCLIHTAWQQAAARARLRHSEPGWIKLNFLNLLHLCSFVISFWMKTCTMPLCPEVKAARELETCCLSFAMSVVASRESPLCFALEPDSVDDMCRRWRFRRVFFHVHDGPG